MTRDRLIRCAHPGCGKTLKEGTWTFSTGCCLVHQPTPEPKPQRQDVRIAVVHLVPGCSTLAASRSVSVRREPWL
jgi:hypothetical protein